MLEHKYYTSAITGETITLEDIRHYYKIFGADEKSKEYLEKNLIPHTNSRLSVIDFLKENRKASAILYYKEIHNTDIFTAKKAVEQIQQDMDEIQSR